MKGRTASCMLEWFVYTVVAVGFGRGGLADAGRRRGLDGRVDHAGTVCGPAGACGALLPVPEHRRVARHAPAGLAFPGDGQAWVAYGRLAEPTDAGMGPGCPLSRLRGHSRGRMARTRAWDGRRHPGLSAPDADMAGNRLATGLGSSFSLQIVG